MYSKAIKRMNLLFLLVLFIFSTNVAVSSADVSVPISGSAMIDFQSTEGDDETESGDDEDPEC
ncbi:MAG: hypothetical protein KTR18_16110 [Acidiferrobacterales bacterium]|nr:hypothetical protein [Acidiferrobacterales bacterium]